MKRPLKVTAFGAALVVLTIGAAPLLSSAADHIDASAFGSLGTSGGAFNPMSMHGERDINDVYAFQGHDASRTVLVMTTNPAINAFEGKYGANVRYILNVDRNGDAVQDLAYVVRFDDGALGNQHYTVTRYTGANAVSLKVGDVRGSGSTAGNGMAALKGDGRIFAGVRSDPFFFDLTGFVGTLFHIGSDALGSTPTDFFAGLDTNAIVIEVPDDQLGGKIGVWGQTTWWNGSSWMPGDQARRHERDGGQEPVQRHPSLQAADRRRRPVPDQRHHHADPYQRSAGDRTSRLHDGPGPGSGRLPSPRHPHVRHVDQGREPERACPDR
jgi:hypothetical protein